MLIEECLPTIYREAIQSHKTHGFPGIEVDDLISEGVLVYYRVRDAWDQTRGASFLTFLSVCVRRRLKDILVRSWRMRTVSIDSVAHLLETLPDMSTVNGMPPMNELSPQSQTLLELATITEGPGGNAKVRHEAGKVLGLSRRKVNRLCAEITDQIIT